MKLGLIKLKLIYNFIKIIIATVKIIKVVN